MSNSAGLRGCMTCMQLLTQYPHYSHQLKCINLKDVSLSKHTVYIPYSRPLRPGSRSQFIHTVTYLTNKKQTVLEGLPGQMNFLAANFGAPDIEGFPLLEEGKEGDADQLAVVLILLFPALTGYEVKLLFVHWYHTSMAYHQIVILTVLIEFNFGGIVQLSTTLNGKGPFGGTWGWQHILGQLRSGKATQSKINISCK